MFKVQTLVLTEEAPRGAIKLFPITSKAEAIYYNQRASTVTTYEVGNHINDDVTCYLTDKAKTAKLKRSNERSSQQPETQQQTWDAGGDSTAWFPSHPMQQTVH